MSERKTCNVSLRSGNKAKKCHDNDDEVSVVVLFKEKEFGKAMKAMMKPRRETNWLLVLQFVWFGLSYLSGLYETKDGILALGYLFYNLIFLVYAIILSIVPFLGIYTLIVAGNTESFLATSFGVNLANPWIAFGVNGLYVVLGWIIQGVVVFIVVFIIIGIAAAASNR